MSEDANRAERKPPHLDRLSALWRRLNEHKIVQWSVAYVALAYGIQHSVTLTSEAFEWPHAVERVTMLLLILGLPVVMTLAWYHGARASRHFSHAELSIISILLVIGSMLFYVLVRPSEGTASLTRPPPRQAVAGAISIAVLPFANLSGDATQEFFSDGMTEEIMTALAKIPSLRVVGRESAFQYKGQKPEMRAVGGTLGANYLIEGSVRKEGSRVRITAQLVQADNGVSLWTNSYDRELTSVFATQEDIAQSIAGALRVPLGLERGDTLVHDRTNDEATYEDYLRAKVLYRSRGYERLLEAIKTLESVVARDPKFAPAWARLALVYAILPDYHPAFRNVDVEELRPVAEQYLGKAEAAARKAIELDPKIPDAYSALAQVRDSAGRYVESVDLYSQALALDPVNPDTLHLYSGALSSLGRIKEALAVRGRLQVLEPFVPVFVYNNGRLRWIAGETAEPTAILSSLGDDLNAGVLARIYAQQGRYQEAADALTRIGDVRYAPGRIETAAKILRSAPAVMPPTDTPPKLAALAWIYGYVGRPELTLQPYEEMLTGGFRGAYFNFLWAAPAQNIRKTERFKALVRNAGFVDYWKARGWPDLCRSVGANDFVCD